MADSAEEGAKGGNVRGYLGAAVSNKESKHDQERGGNRYRGMCRNRGKGGGLGWPRLPRFFFSLASVKRDGGLKFFTAREERTGKRQCGLCVVARLLSVFERDFFSGWFWCIFAGNWVGAKSGSLVCYDSF